MNFSAIPRDSLAGKLFRLPLRLLPRDTIVPVMQGVLRGKKWIVGSGNHGYWLGCYEAEKVKVFADALRSKAVVYDIGANVGYYSMIASLSLGKDGQVIAFEPDARNIPFFRRHLSMNDIENVQLVEAAVSDRSGTASFRQEPSRLMGALSDHGTVTVRTVALDDFMRGTGVPVPDVVKIDVEGSEMRVLKGAERVLSTERPLVFLATHSRLLHRECCEFLASLKYMFRPIHSVGQEISNEIFAFWPTELVSCRTTRPSGWANRASGHGRPKAFFVSE